MEETQRLRGPFRPGPGGPPPYLAGREHEQALFCDQLTDLGKGEPPESEVVLYGPRGNGKTALLGWLHDEAARRPSLDAVHLTPSTCRSTVELAERLLAESWWRRLTPAEMSVGGFGWKPGEERPPIVEEVLRARASRRPLLLMLDEAHTLDPEVGRLLLNASQVVGRRLPLLLVLAGTPGLRAHLSRMEASFWSRALSLPIGRLDVAASTEAIRRPLETDGIAIPEDLLTRVVQESHGYPFFLQLWGGVIWRRVMRRGDADRRVRPEDIEAARGEFDARRSIYYLDRYEEFREADRLPVARAVADAFHCQPRLDDAELEIALRRALGEAAPREELRAAEAMIYSLGYIWRPTGEPKWEPGIPSLMDYLRENTPALA